MRKLSILGTLAALLIVATSCNKLEKILPKKDGLWNLISNHTHNYFNDSLISEETQVDSLGTIFFDSDGHATATDGSGETTHFDWSVNDDNDEVTMIDSSGFSITYIVDESSKNEQTWSTSFTFTVGSDVSRTDMTIVMERAE